MVNPMNKKVRRQINGYIWNEQIAQLRETLDTMRAIITKIVLTLEQRPISVRLLLSYTVRLALQVNVAASALRELEVIAQEPHTEQ